MPQVRRLNLGLGVDVSTKTPSQPDFVRHPFNHAVSAGAKTPVAQTLLSVRFSEVSNFTTGRNRLGTTTLSDRTFSAAS